MKKYQNLVNTVVSQTLYHSIYLFYTIAGKEQSIHCVVSSPLTNEEMLCFIDSRRHVDVTMDVSTYDSIDEFEHVNRVQCLGWNKEIYGLDAFTRILLATNELKKADQYKYRVVLTFDGSANKVFNFRSQADAETFLENASKAIGFTASSLYRI